MPVAKVMLSFAQAMQKCRDAGYIISASRLYEVAKSEKFCNKEVDGFHFQFEEKALERWIKKAIAKIPPGWITIVSAADILQVSVEYLYTQIRNEKLIGKVYGPGKGALHVHIEAARSYVKLHFPNYKDEGVSNGQ